MRYTICETFLTAKFLRFHYDKRLSVRIFHETLLQTKEFHYLSFRLKFVYGDASQSRIIDVVTESDHLSNEFPLKFNSSRVSDVSDVSSQNMTQYLNQARASNTF